MDRDLVERAIAGDREAYSELVRRSLDRSYALATLILRDAESARDATQDAYVAAWRDLSSLRDPGRFDAWIRKVVVRACYREAAQQRRHRHVEVRELDLRGSAPDGEAALSQRDQLERGFRRLDPDQRTALVLHHYLGLSVPEVAEAMGVPVGTAKSRIHRATNAMRATLEADARTSLLPEGPAA